MSESDQTLSDKAILCVDDEAIILLSLLQELKRNLGNQYTYERATSAEAALRIIDELDQEGIRVVLIISDWLMPGIKGDEFIEIVKQKHPEIKVIMITGQADKSAIERVSGIASVVAVLKKPWRAEELIHTVRSTCSTCL
ncbi:response regulator [Marispirochaeta sp.]|uniref:response regulator n=1 Tax=Marispirochaeta sp. TaxID=2038653 RepID=UPI0029C96CE1|nr:response regulator [Marispirochaeta sp.]